MQSLNEMFNSSQKPFEIGPVSSNKDLTSVNIISSNLNEVNHVKQLSIDIGSLYNKTDYCDITLIIEGVELQAHKIILAARSEYFRALLYSGMRETHCQSVVINEAKLEAFKLLLR